MQLRDEMRRAWLIWSSTTLFLALYLAAGYVESYPFETPIKLEAGHSARVRIVRLAADPILMSLVFPEDNHHRPELGFIDVARPWPASEEKRYLRPGSAIRLQATVGAQSVRYDAEPTYGHSRMLTSNLAISPGVWRWPPPLDLPRIILPPGITELSVEVLAVDAPLAGQSARLFVHPPLSFKISKKDIGWVGLLGFGFLWPVLIPAQMLWALFLDMKRYVGKQEP